LFLIIFSNKTVAAEPWVQIRSPKDGAQITQEQEYLLVSGKVASGTVSSSLVDVVLVLDVSGSTAYYAGTDFYEFSQLPNFYVRIRPSKCPGNFKPGRHNLRTSILAAEIVASRRLLSQLNPETTRVGVVTFADEVSVRQPLTHDFAEVRSALDLIYKRGPLGGTNMVDAIRVATDELLVKGQSEKYLDSTKALLLMTDGFPTLPAGDCPSFQADADLAIDAARRAGQAGVSVHVFALGEEALSNPRAAVGIAKESGGTYTAVTRPADVLAIVDNVSAVGVNFLHVTNETMGQKALQSRLAADGFFASAVPLVEGLNRIQVLARSSDGAIGKDTITVHYQAGAERSLELEVFIEREKSLKLEVKRLGRSLGSNSDEY
jgi:Mg-chelatase subunit ChlD